MNTIKTHLISILLILLCVSTATAQHQTRLLDIKNVPVEKSEGGVVQEPASADALRIVNLMEDERKYRRRATTYGVLGGVSLGVGAVLTTSGILAFAGNKHGNPLVDFGGIILTSAGGLFTLGSVPLFIACHKQSVKAASISATIKAIATPGSVAVPAVGLSVTF